MDIKYKRLNKEQRIKLNVLLTVILMSTICLSCESSYQKQSGQKIIPDQWQPLKTIDEGGLIGERVDLWRNNRLWNIAESGYLIDGFENRPGEHPWQGEHLGKWLHAATLAYQVTGDTKLKKELEEIVERLLSTQLPNGYMGTYGEEYTFMALPENVMKKNLADDIETGSAKGNKRTSNKNPQGGWDVWTHRYNIYGLLTYEKYFPDKKIVEACKKMGDLLMEYYGKDKFDLTKYGSRQGISSTTLLESIVMLYERTLDTKYLDFAEHIVQLSENNPKLRLMGTMLENGSVVYPGDGKAYQLMANLLGYLRLYRCTGKDKYLQTVLNGWEEIHKKHILVTGGPWTRKMSYNGNRECFAHVEAFNPEKVVVEGCCDATWILLNISLFELTGKAEYFSVAEVTLLNSVYGYQNTDGIEWCYFTTPNEKQPKYESRYHCCGSSEPRGLEMYSCHLAGIINETLSVNSLAASTIALTENLGGGCINIKSGFPLKTYAEIHYNGKGNKQFVIEFRLPLNSLLKDVKVNGENNEAKMNKRGFYELNREWNEGDIVSIEWNYELKEHIQTGEDGKKWVAFTYGPVTLAQKITDMPDEEPFIDLESKDLPQLLDRLTESSDSEIRFAVKGTDIALIPYYQTGSKQSGPRTYFELKDHKKN